MQTESAVSETPVEAPAVSENRKALAKLKIQAPGQAQTQKIPELPPENGLRGLKHWRHDLLAGIVVSLVSLPLSLGIAIASGAPPIAGLISAIIAGLIFPFLGGAFVTISGPAAGLAPVLLATMTVLGKNNLENGYPLLLVAIMFAGAIQVVLSMMKVARLSAIFPNCVVQGMLAAIGLSLIVKQLPIFIGIKFSAHEIYPIVGEFFARAATAVPQVLTVGVICLATLFALSAIKSRWIKLVPPQLLVVLLGIALGKWMNLDPKYLIKIPANPLAHGIVLPNFAGLFNDQTIWVGAAIGVITIMLVDGIESLATIGAIDKIDPYQRKSDPDRTLFTMGVSNMLSSLAGGLTIIPGGIKSTTCIVVGGRTLWANFYNAVCLILYLCVARDMINMIPLAALGAVLLHIGYQLCKPAVWIRTARMSKGELLAFSTTVFVTLQSDLLYGIAAGTLVTFGMIAWTLAKNTNLQGTLVGKMANLFRNPVVRTETHEGSSHIYFGGPLVCFNLMHIRSELAKIPENVSEVYLHVTKSVPIVDFTAGSALMSFRENRAKNGRLITLDGLGSTLENKLRTAKVGGGH